MGVGVSRVELEHASEQPSGAASITSPPALHPFLEGLVGCVVCDGWQLDHGGLPGGWLSLWLVRGGKQSGD